MSAQCPHQFAKDVSEETLRKTRTFKASAEAPILEEGHLRPTEGVDIASLRRERTPSRCRVVSCLGRVPLFDYPLD